MTNTNSEKKVSISTFISNAHQNFHALIDLFLNYNIFRIKTYSHTNKYKMSTPITKKSCSYYGRMQTACGNYTQYYE